MVGVFPLGESLDDLHWEVGALVLGVEEEGSHSNGAEENDEQSFLIHELNFL